MLASVASPESLYLTDVVHGLGTQLESSVGLCSHLQIHVHVLFLHPVRIAKLAFAIYLISDYVFAAYCTGTRTLRYTNTTTPTCPDVGTAE